MPLLLHLGHQIGTWSLEPSVVTGAFIALAFYAYGVLTLKDAFNGWRAASFTAGVAAMFLALVSPLDSGADRLLSLHMLQHVAITTVGPPLLLLGLTPALIDPVLRLRLINRVARTVTHPLFAGTLFIVNMWFWHVPPVYGAALDHLAIHITMHLAFIATGILFWWPVIQPTPATGRHGDGARLLYLFATGMPMGLLALLFFASSGVIYDHYATVDRLWGVSATDDQQIAGLVMGALGEAASFAAITILFFRFLDHEDAVVAGPGPVPGRTDAT
ncbi:MAG TPA: cytochrome c oxidase assembly protein [Dehalococcoidia bacterium]|nr:cytochrome c oxidase assembly protein [Dehalococcoidia bacterium]